MVAQPNGTSVVAVAHPDGGRLASLRLGFWEEYLFVSIGTALLAVVPLIIFLYALRRLGWGTVGRRRKRIAMGASAATAHPDSAILALFAAGQLRSSEIERVGHHVAECSVCLAILEQLPQDAMVKMLRDHRGRVDSALMMACRALPIIGVGLFFAVIVWAVISAGEASLLHLRVLGDDVPRILLIAFAGIAVCIAVCIRSLARLMTAARLRAARDFSKQPRVRGIRNAVASAIVLSISGFACVDLWAFALSRYAVHAVSSWQLNWTKARPNRQVVETRIGRSADDVSLGIIPGEVDVTYRWRGIFRTYVLRAHYLRPPNVPWPAEEEERLEKLGWINDVLE
jgi:hypothetical protein